MARFELVMVTDAGDGQVVPIATDTFRIGRAPTNHLAVPDSTVSWNHTQLWLEGPALWVRDLGSRNGTFVNEDALKGPRPLATGDVVRVGKTMRFRVTHSEASPSLDLLQLEDVDSGMLMMLRPGPFHLGSGDRVHLRVDGTSAREATVITHPGGEVWLQVGDDEERILAVDEAFQVGARRFRVVQRTLDHAPTVEFGGAAFDYRLRATLNGERGAYASVEDTRSGKMFEATGNRAILLYLLARKLVEDRKGRVSEDEQGWCTDGEISSGIWGRSGGGRSGLNVLVHRLRKSLESADFEPWFIEKRRRGIRALVADAAVS